MSIKENARSSDTWIHGLFILIFGIIFYFLYGIIWLLVIIQFITKVVTGQLNDNLSDFSVKLTDYAEQILLYITYQSSTKPWPFDSSSEAGEDSETLEHKEE